MTGVRRAFTALAVMLILLMASAGAPAQAAGPGRVKVIVDYARQPGRADVARLRALGASIRFRYRTIPAIAATLPAAALRDARALRGVRRVERDHPLVLFEHGPATGDPELENAWGVEHIGGGRAHQAGELGAGIRVAVIDTGIDCSHPDLDANCAGGISYIPSAPFPDGVPFDDYGHGTHVSGIIAAEMDHSQGVVGVAPSARLVAMKVLDQTGQGDYSGLVAALDQVAIWNSDGSPGNDIDVVNMSLGGSEVSAVLQDAVVSAHASGAVLVAASGNVNPFDIWQLIYGCPVAYPGAYSQVLSTTFTNGSDLLTGYSCTGPEVDFAAPGDNVNSTVPTSGPLSSSTRYTVASGTSMASPHLAGTVALLLEHGITDGNGNGLLQDDIKAHLCATATQGYGRVGETITPSDPRYSSWFGCGVVSAGRALVDQPPDPPPPPPPNRPPTSDAGGPYSGPEGTAIAVDGTPFDPDGDSLTKLWTWAAGAGVDAGATCTFGNDAHADTTITCTDDGTYTLTFSVDDGPHAPVTDSATLTVSNVRPTVAIDSPAEGAAFETGQVVNPTVSRDDAGANDKLLTCSIDWGDGSPAGPCSDTHQYQAAGAYTITATVDDGDQDGTASASVGITVTDPPPPNDPPSADAGGDRSGAEGEALSLDGTASDDPGDTLTTSWSWDALTAEEGASCAFANASAVDTTVTCTDDGTFELTLSVEDGHNPTVADTATLTLSNVKPSVTIESPAQGAEFQAGATVNPSITRDDAGANDKPLDCTIDWGDSSTDGACSDTHQYSVAGAYTITASVDDRDGGTASDTVGITVTAPPPPPTLTFTAVADAYVRASRATTNYGRAKVLRVQSGAYRSYLRFDVTGVSGTVAAVKLRLYVAEVSPNGGTVNTHANLWWDERTITWNSSPAVGTPLAEVGGASTVGQWVVVDLTGKVPTDGTVSLVLTGGSSNSVDYQSREAANDPQLVLTLAP